MHRYKELLTTGKQVTMLQIKCQIAKRLYICRSHLKNQNNRRSFPMPQDNLKCLNVLLWLLKNLFLLQSSLRQLCKFYPRTRMVFFHCQLQPMPMGRDIISLFNSIMKQYEENILHGFNKHILNKKQKRQSFPYQILSNQVQSTMYSYMHMKLNCIQVRTA